MPMAATTRDMAAVQACVSASDFWSFDWSGLRCTAQPIFVCQCVGSKTVSFVMHERPELEATGVTTTGCLGILWSATWAEI